MARARHPIKKKLLALGYRTEPGDISQVIEWLRGGKTHNWIHSTQKFLNQRTVARIAKDYVAGSLAFVEGYNVAFRSHNMEDKHDRKARIIQIIPASGWYVVNGNKIRERVGNCPLVSPVMFWALRDNGEMECHTARYGLSISDIPPENYLYDPLGEKVMFDQGSASKLELRLKLLG